MTTGSRYFKIIPPKSIESIQEVWEILGSHWQTRASRSKNSVTIVNGVTNSSICLKRGKKMWTLYAGRNIVPEACTKIRRATLSEAHVEMLIWWVGNAPYFALPRFMQN